MDAGAVKAGKAYVEITTENAGLRAGLAGAQQEIRTWRDGVQAMGRAGKGMLLGGGTVLAGMGAALKVFSGFDDQMRAVQAVSGATGEAFARLTMRAEELGRTTSFTAAQVAAGMLNLARAGFSTGEIEASIQGMLDLSRATGTDLAESADIAAGTLRAFNMEADQMGRVADVLVATANNSAQTLTDLGESMKYAAPIALEYGLTLEETSKALGVLANMSIKGTMAGTSMRQIMLALSDTKTQDMLRDLGIEATDATGNLRPLGQVMAELGSAMSKMTSSQRLAVGKELFDQRAVGAVMKLARTDFPALNQAIDDSKGKARETAEVMDAGLGGSFRKLSSAAEGVMIGIGRALSGITSSAFSGLAAALNFITEWIPGAQTAVVVMGSLAAAVTGLGAVLLGLSGGIKVAAFALSGFPKALALARAAMLATAVSWEKATWIMAAGAVKVQAALTAVMAHPVIAGLAVVAAAVAAIGIAAAWSARQAGKLRDEMSRVRAAGDQIRGEDQAKMQRLQQLSAKPVLSNAETKEAAKLAGELEQRYGDVGIQVNQLTNSVEVAAGAFQSLADAMRETAAAQLDKEIAEKTANIKKLNDSITDVDLGAWAPITTIEQGYGGAAEDVAEIENKRNKEQTELQALIKRRKALTGGDAGAISGDPTDTVQARVDAARATAEAETKIASDYANRIRDLKIAAIEDEQARALAAIDEKYRREFQQAGGTEQARQAMEPAWKLERANAEREFNKRNAEEQIRNAMDLEQIRLSGLEQTYEIELDTIKARAEAERQIARVRGDTAAEELATAREKAELEAAASRRAQAAADYTKGIYERLQDQVAGFDPSGKERLQLDRQRALSEARRTGADEQSVGRLFDLQAELQELQSRKSSFSSKVSFSGTELARSWSGTLSTSEGTESGKQTKLLQDIKEELKRLRKQEGAMWG